MVDRREGRGRERGRLEGKGKEGVDEGESKIGSGKEGKKERDGRKSKNGMDEGKERRREAKRKGIKGK